MVDNGDLLAVEARDIVKVYNGVVRALDGVGLSVNTGEIRAILGPNGAGKTTLMRILTTQIPPTSGYARILGYDVVREGQEVRKLIGYVPQEFSVWTDLTGYENLLVYAKLYGIQGSLRGKVIDEALEFMGLYEDRNRLVKTYSGGMIRRLEIAIALMLKPRVLFLDEPTIGLDPRARETVWRRIMEYKKEYGTTIVFNTHYMDEAENYAERITIMNKGRVIAEGGFSELKSYAGILDKIVVRVDSVNEALRVIEGLHVGSVLKVEGSSIIIEVQEPARVLPGLIEHLEKTGVHVYEASIARSGLNEVFIKLTGMTLEEAEKLGRIQEIRSVRREIGRG